MVIDGLRAAIRDAEGQGKDPAIAALEFLREPSKEMEKAGHEAARRLELAPSLLLAGFVWSAMIDCAMAI